MPSFPARALSARARVLVLTAALAALVSCGVASASANPAVFNRETYAYSSAFSPQTEAGLYNVMVLQSTDAWMVPQLKAANPGLKILVYQAMLNAENRSTSAISCVTGPTALTHPGWVLHNQSGSPVLYPGHYVTDPGNSGYQQACVANAIATAKAGGFDGVDWDNLNDKLVWLLPSGTTVPEYPSDASWQAAQYSMLKYTAGQLHARGLLDFANLGGTFLTPGLWQQWTGPLDGSEEEGFTDNKAGLNAGIWAWPRQLANLAWSEANGKMTIVHSWNTTETGNAYGLASMLLVAGSHLSWSTSNGCYTNCETWYPEYRTAQYLGAPTGAYKVLSNGVYERTFQHGVVVVNPTANTVPWFSIPGGPYTTAPGQSKLTGVSMGPTSGFILHIA